MNMFIDKYTMLPTKDETSETIVQNLYCLYPTTLNIFFFFYLKSLNKRHNKNMSRLNETPELSNSKRFRSSFHSHPLWVTLYISDITKVNGRTNMTFKQFPGFLFKQCPNFMNLSRGLNLPKTGFN